MGDHDVPSIRVGGQQLAKLRPLSNVVAFDPLSVQGLALWLDSTQAAPLPVTGSYPVTNMVPAIGTPTTLAWTQGNAVAGSTVAPVAGRSGNGGVRIVNTTGLQDHYVMNPSQFTLLAGITYTLSAYYRIVAINGAGTNNQGRWAYFEASGPTSPIPAQAVTDGWVRSTVTFTPGSNGAYYIRLYGLNGTVEWSDALLHVGSTPVDYAPGTTITVPYSYTSGPVLARDTFTRGVNLLSNPSFESGTTGWSGSLVTLTASSAWAASGTQSASLVPTTSGTDSYMQPTWSGWQGARTYTVSGTINTPVAISGGLHATRAQRIVVFVRAPSTSNLYVESVSASGPAVGSARLSLTFTTPADVNDVLIRFYNGAGNSATNVVYWDAVQLEVGSTATAFSAGDASSLGVTDTGQAWTAHSGTLGVVGGQADGVGGDNYGTIEVGTGDVDVSVTFAIIGAGNYPGPLLRYADMNNYLRLYVNSGPGSALVVRYRVAGVNTDHSLGGAWQDGDVCRVVVSGSTLTLYRNGTQVAQRTDAPLPTSTRHGVWLTVDARFDDFTVRAVALTDGDPISVWPDRSGNGRHAVQATSAKRPLWRSSGRNLLSYNTATIETDTAGWYASTNVTISRSTAAALHGAASLSLSSNAAGTMGAQTGFGTVGHAVTPGKVYAARVSSRAATTGRSVYVGIVWQNAAGGNLGQTLGSTATNTTTGWTEHTVVGVAPAGAATCYLTVPASGTAAAGEVHYLDAAGVFDVTPTWSAGGTGGNLLTADAASFETGTGGWTALGGTVSRSTAVATDGSASLFVTSTGNRGRAEGPVTTVAIGNVLHGQVDVYNPNAGSIGFACLINDGSAATQSATVVVPPGEWRTLTHTHTATNTSGRVIVQPVDGAGTMNVVAGTTSYVDRASLRVLSAPAWVPPVTTPNGQPVIQFDGVDDLLTAVGVTLPAGTVTAYMVATRDGSQNNGRYFGLHTASEQDWNGAPRFSFYRNSGTTASLYRNANVAQVTDAAAGVAAVYTVRLDGTNGSVRMNGGTAASGASSGALTVDRLTIAAEGATGAAALALNVAAVLVYDTAHDDTTRKKVEAYLGKTYGITVAS